MACCAAIALVFGIVRWGWRVLTLRGAAAPGLAAPPQAFRPAPSATPRAPAAPTVRRPSVPTRERVVCSLRFFAGGAALYAGAVALLLAAGAAQHEPAPAVGWLMRGAVLVALATVALIAAVALERPGPAFGARVVLSCGLIGAGAAWLALGIVDQHAFGLYVIAHGSLGWDLAFHGAGEWAIAAGLLTLRSSTTFSIRRRPPAAALSSR